MRNKTEKSKRASSSGSSKESSSDKTRKVRSTKQGKFHLEFKNASQRLAWATFQQHDVLFLNGPAGVGKSFLAMAFAINEVLQGTKKKIILTRPIVEAGEHLGFLPGDFNEKVHPYMVPLYDCISKLVGVDNMQREIIDNCIEVAPLAYLRGRAETLDSLLVTPNGLVPMGDIKINDFVIGSNGKPIKVTGVYPQGKKKIWKINFTDKTFVKCSEDHLWSTMTLNEKRHNKGYSVKITKDIIETIKNKHNQKIHRMPELTGVVQFEPREISINPYLLGLMLGDGYIGRSDLNLSTNDQEIIEICKTILPEGMTINQKSKYDYDIIFDQHKRNPLSTEFKKYSLVGKKSHNKFVPEDFKINSEEVRLEVLRGLMDSDGSVFVERRTNKVRTQFYSVSYQLAQDVMFLVRSLGGFAYYRKREFDESDSHLYKGRIIRHTQPSYVVDIRMNQNPFKLKRKAEKYENGVKTPYVKLIASAEFVGEEECQCISVDATDRLYLTNGFNITHNTMDDAICILDEAQNTTMSQMKLFLTRLGENSKMIVNGDPTQSDLGIRPVALSVIMKKLQNVPGISIINFGNECIVRHPLVGAILKELESKENAD